jgi:hypothetical protein
VERVGRMGGEGEGWREWGGWVERVRGGEDRWSMKGRASV